MLTVCEPEQNRDLTGTTLIKPLWTQPLVNALQASAGPPADTILEGDGRCFASGQTRVDKLMLWEVTFQGRTKTV